MDTGEIMEVVKREMRRQGLNMAQVARLAGVSYQCIWQWDKGKNKASVHELDRVARAIGYELTLVKRGDAGND